MPARIGPIEALSLKLHSYLPRSISALIAIVQDNESYADFLHIVREFVPEHQSEILRRTAPEEQIAEFARFFRERYFPLDEWFESADTDTTYEALTRSIPLIPLGFSWEDYDTLVANGHEGYMLMTYFFRQPYDDDGARVALGDACEQYVPRDLLQKVPENGFSPDAMHGLLDGTPYAALAVWGDMLNLSTGNAFLDVDQEMYGNSVPPMWDREEVEWLAREWREAEQKQEPVNNMATAFENAPRAFFQEVIDFISKRQEEQDGSNADQGT